MEALDKKKKILLGILICVACILYWGTTKEPEEGMLLTNAQDTEAEAPMAIEKTTEEAILIYVDISGAVNHPLVAQLPEGSRVFEAIELAGGITADGDPTSINLAEQLTDGQKIWIPYNETSPKYRGSSHTDQVTQDLTPTGGFVSGTRSDQRTDTGSIQGKININRADHTALQQLKGIGPAMAGRIVDYRTTNGKFTKIEDLKKVKGVGEKTFQRLKDSITI